MAVFTFGSGGGKGNGTDFSQVTMQPRDGREGKQFFDKDGILRKGTIPNWDGDVTSGPSFDSRAHRVPASAQTRHIPAGQYLDHDIELEPMDDTPGSAAMAQDGGKVILRKEAGHIDGGEEELTINPGSAAMSLVGNKVRLSKAAGYISAGQEDLSIPLQNGTPSITANGVYNYTPTGGNVGFGSFQVNVSVPSSQPNLQNKIVTITNNGSETFGPDVGYDGLARLTVRTQVPSSTPSTGSGSVSASGNSMIITAPPGKTLLTVGFISSSAPGNDRIAGGSCHQGSSIGRAVVQTYSGVAVGDILSVTWNGGIATISSTNSSYTFSGTYTVYMAYA